MQPRPFVARSERLTTAVDLPRPAGEGGAVAPEGRPSGSAGPDTEKQPGNAGASAPPAAPSPSGDKAAPASSGASDAPEPGSERAEAAPAGGAPSTDAARPKTAVPWPHSGSESDPASKPAPGTTASEPSPAQPGEAPRLKSNDLTRPFSRGPEPTDSGEPNGSAADPATKKGAHALHTGAYPVVSEPVSMRPRNEPAPEPAELFRPAARDEKRTSPAATPESTVKVAAVKPSNG